MPLSIPLAVAAAADVREGDRRRAGGRVGAVARLQLVLEPVVGRDRAGLVHRHRDRVARVRRAGDIAGPVAEVVAAARSVGDLVAAVRLTLVPLSIPLAVAAAADVREGDRTGWGRVAVARLSWYWSR